jgi:hypothetical protein
MLNFPNLEDKISQKVQDNDKGTIIDDTDIDSDGLDEQNLKLKKKELEIRLLSDDINIRKSLSYWAAVVVSIFLLLVLIVLLLSGTGRLKLSDVVLSTLLATTTLNVLGLMFIVLKGYFAASNQRV